MTRFAAAALLLVAACPSTNTDKPSASASPKPAAAKLDAAVSAGGPPADLPPCSEAPAWAQLEGNCKFQGMNYVRAKVPYIEFVGAGRWRAMNKARLSLQGVPDHKADGRFFVRASEIVDTFECSQSTYALAREARVLTDSEIPDCPAGITERSKPAPGCPPWTQGGDWKDGDFYYVVHSAGPPDPNPDESAVKGARYNMTLLGDLERIRRDEDDQTAMQLTPLEEVELVQATCGIRHYAMVKARVKPKPETPPKP
jgi:hypothetical protein